MAKIISETITSLGEKKVVYTHVCSELHTVLVFASHTKCKISVKHGGAWTVYFALTKDVVKEIISDPNVTSIKLKFKNP